MILAWDALFRRTILRRNFKQISINDKLRFLSQCISNQVHILSNSIFCHTFTFGNALSCENDFKNIETTAFKVQTK